ncbi:phthiocerol/phthiodiolone dimycocerosyl transferase family protein, partial [Nocardia cyriacigeorgica]
AGVRDALERREAAMVLLAARRVGDDPVMAAVLSTPPSFTISNIGRLPAHSLPNGLVLVRDDIFAMAPDISPKLTVFTVGDRMTVQVEFDTARYSRTRQRRVRDALEATLRGIAVAVRAGLG